MITCMPANDFFGIDRTTLAASGAAPAAREIAQQPRMLEATHALVAALKARWMPSARRSPTTPMHG